MTTINFIRVKGHGKYSDFEVLIDGELRAKFIHSNIGAGYDLYDTNRLHIASRHGRFGFGPVSQSDFEHIVQTYLGKNKIGTLAEQAFDKVFDQAKLDNRKFDDDKQNARLKLERDVLLEALEAYRTTDIYKEKVAIQLLNRYTV